MSEVGVQEVLGQLIRTQEIGGPTAFACFIGEHADEEVDDCEGAAQYRLTRSRGGLFRKPHEMFVCGGCIVGARFALAMHDGPHLWGGTMR